MIPGVSNVLSAFAALTGLNAEVIDEGFQHEFVRANERNYDVRPVTEQTEMASLRRFVMRPPAGWEAS
ncbi:hypothetical protein [Sphingomonas sp. S6]|uniref:hypothetical protein n=1 Tax=Sphingomonas sp. S6 TaxID=3368600 RepID=UPI000FC2D73E|nr:hypothetical protein [uncultured Sphingomonas sp.]RTL21719.1 MAG: hypothetical protein EKK50_02905 [Sphingomonadaceae bacterium]